MGSLAGVAQLADQFKLELTKLPALPPVYEQGPNSQQQLLLARQVLELAVLLSIRQQDEAAFERNFNQLRVYYSDARRLLPPSNQEALLLSLNLLRLLVQNRIAEFHTELELLPAELQHASDVAQVTELEQWLMEGAYNKVLDARRRAVSEYYAYFLEQLSSTVRDEVASCSERAYQSLSVPDAMRMLMFSSEQEAVEYAQQRGWEASGGRLIFKTAAGEGGGAAMEEDQAGGAANGAAAGGLAQGPLAAQDLIGHCLTYAKELERIV
ncbi:hypothetical protein N2152v2_004021 [Parachlorella kessleri]